MPLLTALQIEIIKVRLSLIEELLKGKRNEWNAIYKQATKTQGPSVAVKPGSKEYKVWSDLLALRTERNNLLSTLRDSGENI